ncbi:uncharacterized protein BJ212DRAFT_1300459 [Suillus subaureus]|uniref:Uncharacterized protein n=1 Tax=Suillus subaureus TaxID=48587 RepID=A0A9P7E9C1_9AGAM|nr:uncharacterized protein BJ212DRAFT_1300459 [Suillus subaureus]KAG1814662.1 hypothetical protein BJ212DRAFT_1300459 [Suillus subaureus]
MEAGIRSTKRISGDTNQKSTTYNPFLTALAPEIPAVIIADEVSRSTFSVKQENEFDITFTASVDHIGEDCSGNRQNLGIIAVTTNFDDTIDFLMFSKTLKLVFLSPLNVYVDDST